MKAMLLIGAMMFLPVCSLLAGVVKFAADADVVEVTDGHIKLEWTVEGDGVTELQQSRASDFFTAKTIYIGPDRASFVSGLDNGNYYYRVRAAGGEWSETLMVKVQHQSLELAFALFGIGGLVFLLTVFVVIKGARQVSLEEI